MSNVKMKASKLSDVLTDYLNCHDLKRDSARQISAHIEAFVKDVGDVEAKKLKPELVNAHLRAMRRDSMSDSHVKNRRQNLCRIWDWAAEMRAAYGCPRSQIMKIRVDDVLPEAWSFEEVCQLLDASRGVSYVAWEQLIPHYAECYVRLVWDAGLRPVDAHSVSQSMIRENVLRFVQPKTGKQKAVFLSDSTLEIIGKTFGPARDHIVPKGTQTNWNRLWRFVIRNAGLHGEISRLRHSAGTDAEIQHPGQGNVLLGNTRAVFEKHYLDTSHLPPPKVRPQTLPV